MANPRVAIATTASPATLVFLQRGMTENRLQLGVRSINDRGLSCNCKGDGTPEGKLGREPMLLIWEDTLLCNTTLPQDDRANIHHLLPDPPHGDNSNEEGNPQDDIADEPARLRLLLFFR